jgi:hypothetical protein
MSTIYVIGYIIVSNMGLRYSAGLYNRRYLTIYCIAIYKVKSVVESSRAITLSVLMISIIPIGNR